MSFTRNVPGWERGVRALLGIALLGAAALVPFAGWALVAAIAAGATMIVTALAGFCPACALAGRRMS